MVVIAAVVVVVSRIGCVGAEPVDVSGPTFDGQENPDVQDDHAGCGDVEVEDRRHHLESHVRRKLGITNVV